MASRAVWKGQLRLSLVSIPVEMHSATESAARISFRQIHKPSGRRVSYEKIVPDIGKVENSDIVMNRTFWVGVYPGLTPSHLDHIIDSLRSFIRKGSSVRQAEPAGVVA